MKKIKKLIAKVRLLLADGQRILLVKVGKDRLAPLDTAQIYDVDKTDCEDIKLDAELTAETHKTIKKAKRANITTACAALSTSGSIFKDAVTGFKLLLIALLATVGELLPRGVGYPVVILQADGTIIQAVGILLEAINGPDIDENGVSCLRPSHVSGVVPAAAIVPSVDLADYIGGKIKTQYGKKWTFWLPLFARAFIVDAGTPAVVRERIITESALAVPIINGFRVKTERPVLKIIATSDFIDHEQLEGVKKLAPMVFAVWSEFRDWLMEKEKRLESCRSEAENRFLPRLTDGRYSAPAQDYEARVMAAGLAVFASFLRFAYGQGWISEDISNEYLTTVWKAVLPESLPAAVSGKGAWDDPVTFFHFLTEYLEENEAHIAYCAPCVDDAVAAVHSLGGVPYLIAPRDSLAMAYSKWLTDRRIYWKPTGKPGLELFRKLVEQGIPVKTEGSDAWRFRFDKSNEKKIPCLAFPLDDLPDSVRQSVGEIPEQTSSPQKGPEVKSDGEKE